MDELGQGYPPANPSDQSVNNGSELKGPPLPKKHLITTAIIAVLLLVDVILGGVIVFNITKAPSPAEEDEKSSITPTAAPTQRPSPTVTPTLIPSVSQKPNTTVTLIPKATNTPAPTAVPTATPTPADTTPPELIDFVGVTEGGNHTFHQTNCYPIRIRDNLTLFADLESRMKMDNNAWSDWDHEHEKCYTTAPGQHTIYAEVRDKAGNVGSFSRTFNVTSP